MSAVVLLLLGLSLVPASLSQCVSRAPSRSCSACVFGGPLCVISVPHGLPVNSKTCDKIYDKAEFQRQPAVSYLDAVTGQTYSLVMMDPDAPNRTLEQSYLHWVRANIPGPDFRVGNLENSDEITSYVGPAPPAGSGLHQYKFLVFRHQNPASRLTQTIESPEREFFSLADYLRNVTLLGVRLCGPIAGVQFRAQF